LAGDDWQRAFFRVCLFAYICEKLFKYGEGCAHFHLNRIINSSEEKNLHFFKMKRISFRRVPIIHSLHTRTATKTDNNNNNNISSKLLQLEVKVAECKIVAKHSLLPRSFRSKQQA